jgi:Leucine-rich repeat (LRR) protein
LFIIDINGNKIEKISSFTFSNLNSLQTLKLSNNEIKHIEKSAFHKLPKLKGIWLDRNKLEKIDEDLFRGLLNLERIDLSSNNLNFSDKKPISLYLERIVEVVALQSYGDPLDIIRFVLNKVFIKI